MASSTSTKVATVIVSQTRGALMLKVVNRNCFTRLATIGVGCEHKVEVDVNWTYQEYSFQPAAASDQGSFIAPVPPAGGRFRLEEIIKEKVVVISSEDCCDFERVTVTDDQSGESFQVDRVARWQSTRSGHVPTFGATKSVKWWTYLTWPKLLNWRLWTL